MKRLVQSGVKEAKVTDYCTKLSAMAISYKKVSVLEGNLSYSFA